MKLVTIALPEVRNCRITGWRLLRGHVRGIHFKPLDGGHNRFFASTRQLDEAIARAAHPDRLTEGIITTPITNQETPHG